MIEADGDRLLLSGDYLSAIERYRQAQILFKGINQSSRALILQDKISDTERLEAERISRMVESEIEIIEPATQDDIAKG